MKKTILLIMAFASLVSCSGNTGTSVYDLKCEGLREPLAIDSATPHFSWKLQSDEKTVQTASQIQVASSESLLKKGKADIWDSGKVAGDAQIFVPYNGQELNSRQICWWRVKVWDAEGKASAWSEPQLFGIGIIGRDKIDADFIYMPSDKKSAPIFRKDFSLDKKLGTAILHVNSLGYHEVYINGRKVGDAVLTPAVSQMEKRSLINSYDVAEYLQKGENELVIWAAAGWYRTGAFGLEENGPFIKAELDMPGKDGWECIISTDKDWEAAESGWYDVRPSERNMIGEVIDARLAPSSMDKEGLAKLNWAPVSIKDINVEATPQMCELCKVQETISGKSVIEKDGSWIVDLGKVGNGLLEATVSAPEGTSVKVSVLDEDFSKANWYADFGTYELITTGNPEGDCFKGKFCTNIFRYVKFDGLETAPDPAKVKVHRVRTDYDEAASFECSDPEIQSIHDMIHYTMENLAFNGYMVDCANLERLGYGGDGNASTLSLQTMYDVAPLYSNWLQAWNDATQEDGGQPHTAPEPWAAGGGPYWCTFIVQAPFRTYMSYGDARQLERCYDNMKLSLKYADMYTDEGGLLRRWPDLEYRAWYLGDWLAPRGIDVKGSETVDLVNNCAYAQTFNELVKIAKVLGKDEESKEFQRRLDARRAAIHNEFYHPETNTYGTGSQLDMSYPLLVGAVPEELRETVTAKLVERSETVYNGHLGVGLVGVPVLTEWATLDHKADFMYGMLKKHDYPGYLYMIDNGATGTWENWDDARSHFHNCYNGIGSWFYQALGGIIPLEPGYKKVLVDPQMPAGIDWVKVTKETPYGTIKVSWDNSKGQADVKIDAPVGVEIVRP